MGTGLKLNIDAYKINVHALPKAKQQTKSEKISFGSDAPLYAVKNSNFIKRTLPLTAFLGAVVSFLGYLAGGIGLSYDCYKEKGNSLKNMFLIKNDKSKKEEGIKTITASTKIGQAGMKMAKIGVAASAVSGFTCGLGEGIPTMAIGEATNIGSAKIIETPIGTALFGIGIASIFSGLALENTPELKINKYKLMAAEGIKNKSSLILKNIGGVVKEVLSSVVEIAKSVFSLKELKENFFRLKPRTIVFQEMINKDGIVSVAKKLRHKKNYVMHAASFTLALGGVGIIISSLLNQKKAQKKSLQVEEGGFLFDNLGITQYGLDKWTTNGKSAGASFATGGVINAISQFMGLDNKEGRAVQWLGIALVFLGFSIDRGKTLAKDLKNAKQMEALTDVVREWKLDLTHLFGGNDNKGLKKLLREIRNEDPDNGKVITNKIFNSINSAFETITKGKQYDIDETRVKQALDKALEESLGDELGKKIAEEIKVHPLTYDNNDKKIKYEDKKAAYEKVIEVLKICTKKIFGSENPEPIKPATA